ncbi:flagellar biosynthesis protein FlhB [Pararhizobium mangrovi]|uniref:Flagellar biosynthetic protein FlhB n=1 Tax=Pararhizobium mangrovi TaxID=2590452 RepID=A0A506TUN0_9HYPH|nr:flagellar biosynthesis protein FlhB [Pararhizobium mangrovi]TPW25762.1 flagellar biosynthesis protein FlhB [Pararhizobium mangrovi]
MADEEDKESKTEDPSEKKIRDAIDKGNVPFSREAPIFASVLAILVYLVFFMPSGVDDLSRTLGDVFQHADELPLANGRDALALFRQLAMAVGAFLLPALALMIGFGVAAAVLQNVPQPVVERIRPKLSHISLAKGFKRTFGSQGLVEFGKSLAKVLVTGIAVAIVMRSDFFAALDGLHTEPGAILTVMASDTRQVLTVILIITALIAVADIFWQRYHWFTELKMTKQEVKDEFKQTDGDPLVKSRQRSLQRDRARRRMMDEVSRSTLVVANPTHFAVALRYVREEGGAPVVVAKGQDLIALRIREIAEKNGIPVFEDPPLARSMFAQVSIDSFIPPIFYQAVAELVQKVFAADAAHRQPQP